MNLLVAAFTSALLFGIGLGVSGMTLPAKVIGFLDIFGDWDPSLAFVMLGAIGVHGLSYRLISKRESPILTTKFLIPSRRDIDWRLIAGAVLFGMGWGLGGFCPGPAIVGSVSGHVSVLTFVMSMVIGVFLYNVIDSRFLQKGGK